MRAEPPTIRNPFNPRIETFIQLADLLSLPVDDLHDLVTNAHLMYSAFEVPKPTGGFRIIKPPKHRLRQTQRAFLVAMQGQIRFPRWMTGGIQGRSIFDHARPHVGRELVATLDIHKFFPSTSPVMAARVLTRLGIHEAALEASIRLVTKDGELPQGAPTSSIISNLALEPADRRIDSLCRKHGMQFTRFVDDIAVSGSKKLHGMKGTLIEAIESCGYSIAPEKVKFMERNVAQIVTKLRVNDKLRPTRDFIKEAADLIWLCIEHGAALAAASEGVSVARLKNSLTGKVAHIKQADAALGQRLKRRLYSIDWGRKQHEVLLA